MPLLDKRTRKYIREYKWSNIFTMLKNNRKPPENCELDFNDKLVVLTGATAGIGYVTAKHYASKGANLLCINRNKEKSELLKKEIEKEFRVSCDYMVADLSSIQQTHLVADQLLELDKPIDVLIHNAGVYLTKRELTEDGLEKVFMVHYLSSFIINYKLIDKLKAQNKARVIYVNSEGYRFAAWGLRLDDLNWEKRRYSGLKSYGAAKLAQLLAMLIFDECFKGSGVTINAMHPGAVRSDSGSENGKSYKWFKKHIIEKSLKSPEISAQALYYLGVSPDIENISGKFFNLTTLEEPAPPALDREVAGKLWDISLEMGKLK